MNIQTVFAARSEPSAVPERYSFACCATTQLRGLAAWRQSTEAHGYEQSLVERAQCLREVL